MELSLSDFTFEKKQKWRADFSVKLSGTMDFHAFFDLNFMLFPRVKTLQSRPDEVFYIWKKKRDMRLRPDNIAENSNNLEKIIIIFFSLIFQNLLLETRVQSISETGT